MGNNSFSSKKTVERIREQYPEGCRVELINMGPIQQIVSRRTRYSQFGR